MWEAGGNVTAGVASVREKMEVGKGKRGVLEPGGKVEPVGDGIDVEYYGCRTPLPSFVPQLFRFAVCFTWFLTCVACTLALSVFLLPRRRWRARLVKIFIVAFAPSVFFMYGIRIKVLGTRHRGSLEGNRSVVYLANHSSTLDFVTCSRSLSTGTIAIAKRALLLHPLGWVAWLNGTVFIDRSNRQKAIKSMNSISGLLREYGISVCVFPEGTRSRDGRLQPFKKGAMHLAMQAGVPIVPVVIRGAHKIWGKFGYSIACNEDPIEIEFLDPIDTSAWTAETLAKHTEELHALFVQNLGEDQRPKKEE